MDGYQVPSFFNKGNQEFTECMSFKDGLRCLKAKFDVMMLQVQMDTIMHEIEQGSNVNIFNSYHVICDLCGGYHASNTCMQVQNVDYYDELEHYNPCFDRYSANWSNSSAYGWDNQCTYSDYPYSYGYQRESVQYESKSSWELAIEKLANAPLPWELGSELLANDSNASWELAVENFSNQFEKVANATSDRFDRIEERTDGLTSHFGRMQQLNALWEAISSNNLPKDPSMNGGNVVCENGLHFDQNDDSNLCFNEKMFISHNNVFGANFESQEVSFNDSFFIPLKECIKSTGFKDIPTQGTLMAFPLVNSQVVHIQGNIYETLGIGKSLSFLTLLDHVAFAIKSPFNDPPRPKMVDYSLTKAP
nr:uncharacterized protein LOC113707618 [Coffea arabica]XP_027085771.1 uncharacterized protein LOC113707684 [Coffea arabica]